MKKDTEKKKKEICKGMNDKTDNQPYPKPFTFILNRKEWPEIKPSKKIMSEKAATWELDTDFQS